MTNDVPGTIFDKYNVIPELPFDCDREVFRRAVEAGVVAGRAYLDKLIEEEQAAPGASYAGLIYDPTGLSDKAIAVVNLGGSDNSRLVNGAGKVDWSRKHPDLNFDEAVKTCPWTIGNGQFRWGHAVFHRGFYAGGSGLSATQDAEAMTTIIDPIADGICDHMSARLTEARERGDNWVGGKPRSEYANAIYACGGLMPYTVS